MNSHGDGCLGLHQLTSTRYNFPRNFRRRYTVASNDRIDDRYAHREPHQSPPGEVAER